MSIRNRRKIVSKTILSAAVLVMMSALAGRAEATTTVSGSVETTTDSKTVWKKNSTSVGDFGAGYSAGYTGSTNGSTQSADVNGSVSAELFGQTFELGGLDASANSSGSSYKITSVGKTLADESETTYDSSSLNASFSVTYLKLEETEVIVVVPVTLSVELDGNVGITFSGSMSSSSTDDNITWTATPAVSDSLSASVALGGDAFSVGVSVSVDIINDSMPISLTMDYFPQANQVQYAVTGTLTLTMLDGSMQLFAKSFFLEYDYQLFSWNGIVLDSTVIFTDSIPVASNPYLDLTGGYQATGMYTYEDSAGLGDSSKYEWKIANVYNGMCNSGSTTCQSYTTAETSDVFPFREAAFANEVYLQFCVTPYNGHHYGTQVCSPWTPTGNLVTFYDEAYLQHSSDTQVLGYAYDDDNNASGTCFNLTTPGFNDVTSSISFYPPDGYSAILILYKDINCPSSGTQMNSGLVAAHDEWLASNLANDNFDNMISSFKVIWNDQTGATPLIHVNISANKAYGTYSFNSTGGFSESGSTYVIKRATDSSGTSATTVASGSSSNSGTISYSLTSSDTGKYLAFCVTPSDGYVTGSQSCSDWTEVSTGIVWYSGESQTGTASTVAYTNGDCVSLSDFSLGFTPASLALYGQSSAMVTMKMYTQAGCSAGSEYTRTAGAGTIHNINLDTVGIGSNLKSYVITW